MIESAYQELVPSFLLPSEFWDLDLSELYLITENIRMKQWNDFHTAIIQNRCLVSDMSRALAGKQLQPIENILPPNPRKSRVRTIEEIEMTLMEWANNGE